MNNNAAAYAGIWVNFFRFLIQEMKPRGPWLTPFNVISIPIIITGLDHSLFPVCLWPGRRDQPFTGFSPGVFWLGFDVVTGVALAGGAYVITFVVYVMKVDKYHSIVRVTVLNGLLAYAFYAGALVLRYWPAVERHESIHRQFLRLQLCACF